VKTVLLLLSNDRFSLPLIRYMVLEGRRYEWKTCVASMFEFSIPERIRNEKLFNDSVFISITDYHQCDHAIRKADLVVAMLPDIMMLHVIDLCISNNRSLITPSRLNHQMLSRKAKIKERGILVLAECGFSPGLDHITIKKAIDSIHLREGSISSLKTYSGSVISDVSIDNPWGFKLTEPEYELMVLGKQNNRQLINGKIRYVPYPQVFSRAEQLQIPEISHAVAIPDGDALLYKKLYGLKEVDTLIKGKILRSSFLRIWQLLVNLGFTETLPKIDLSDDNSFYHFLDSLLPDGEDDSIEYRLRVYAGASKEDLIKLKWLGLFEKSWINTRHELGPSSVLQHLLRKKFALNFEDKDSIVMQHHIEYTSKKVKHSLKATLVEQGENKQESALAKAIGITTGAAAKAFLLNNIKVRGLRLPVSQDIYEPMLAELMELGIAFHFEEAVQQDTMLATI
jgi:saccharopine dehydrogenase-like NADP-dependent oxidoreductase